MCRLSFSHPLTSISSWHQSCAGSPGGSRWPCAIPGCRGGAGGGRGAAGQAREWPPGHPWCPGQGEAPCDQAGWEDRLPCQSTDGGTAPVCTERWGNAGNTGQLIHKQFMSWWLKSCENLFGYNFYSIEPTTGMSQFCTCAKLCHDLIKIIQVRTINIFTRCWIWAHKLFVK